MIYSPISAYAHNHQAIYSLEVGLPIRFVLQFEGQVGGAALWPSVCVKVKRNKENKITNPTRIAHFNIVAKFATKDAADEFRNGSEQ